MEIEITAIEKNILPYTDAATVKAYVVIHKVAN